MAEESPKPNITNLIFSSENSTSGLPEDGHNWWGLLAIFVLVFTVWGNTLVCFAIVTEKRLQNKTNYFLMSLAITDLMLAVMVMPVGILVLVTDGFPLPALWCVLWSSMDVLFCTASILHLCMISVDRYLSLRFPMKFGRHKSQRRVVLKIVAVWVLSAGTSMPLTLVSAHNPDEFLVDGVCSIPHPMFLVIGSLICFYIPLVIMVVTYALTIHLLNQQYKGQLKTVSIALGARVTLHKKGKRKFIARTLSSPLVASSLLVTSTLQCPRAAEERKSSLIGRCSRRNSVEHSPSCMGDCHEHEDSSENKDEQKVLPSKSDSQNLKTVFQMPFRRRKQCDKGSTIQLETLSSKEKSLRGTSFHSERKNLLGADTSEDDASIMSDRRDTPLRRKASDDPKTSRKSSWALHSGDEDEWEDEEYNVNKGHSKNNGICTNTEAQSPKGNDNNFLPRMRLKFGSWSFHRGSCQNQSNANHIEEHSLSTMKPKNKNASGSSKCLFYDSDDRSVSPSPAHYSSPSSKVDNSRKNSFKIDDDVLHPSKCSTPRSSRKNSKKYTHEGEPKIPWACDCSTRKEMDKGRYQGKTLYPPTQSDATSPISVNGDDSKDGLRRHQGSVKSDKKSGHLSLQDSLKDAARRSSVTSRVSFDSTEPSYSGSRRGRPQSPTSLARGQTVCSIKRRKSRLKSNLHAEKKASKVLGVVFFTFVIMWSPFFIINITNGVCDSCAEAIKPVFINTVTWLGYASSMVNPIFYTIFNKTFRQTFKRLLLCRRRSRSEMRMRSVKYS